MRMDTTLDQQLTLYLNSGIAQFFEKEEMLLFNNQMNEG